ncbi:MAG: 50S ribosome-binding GTPase [Candidatus Sabulitectum sp.]|nr:50S ribosome-binding GTPase [Candidatus Sabulitectum sp.]
MEQQNDLIAAIATPEAISALSIVRLSGKGASATVEKLMNLKEGRLTGRKRAVGDLSGIDYLVAISWPRGKSYTGEEMVDLICHGFPGTARKILEELERSGARLAVAGEFTRRAWMNGRLTSLDVLTLSAEYREGKNTETNSDLAAELAELTSEIEALIEFSEDHGVSGEQEIGSLLKRALAKTGTLTDRVKSAEILPCAFLMGPVNSGKSTLFNKLNGRETVVVSGLPGTTRDGATRTISLSGRRVEISDTAGCGGQELDSIALELTFGALSSGDRIVWMDPDCEPPSLGTEDKGSYEILKVCSLVDKRETDVKTGWLPLSSITEQGVEEVIQFITATEKGSPSWRLERMANLLRDAILAAENKDVALAAEIVAEVLRETQKPERAGDAVERALERFCVGK